MRLLSIGLALMAFAGFALRQTSQLFPMTATSIFSITNSTAGGLLAECSGHKQPEYDQPLK
jgi:hypothetical protein